MEERIKAHVLNSDSTIKYTLEFSDLPLHRDDTIEVIKKKNNYRSS